jgi:hypothetical protein
MKIAINVCFGGFGLSALAVKTIAEREGKKCFFFTSDLKARGESNYQPLDRIPDGLFWVAFSVPNPNEILASLKTFYDMSIEERQAHNVLYESISLDARYDDEHRTDPLLISVIEELGEKANGRYADLKIIEIPDDVKYEIAEYDGREHVAEVHRTWS